MLLIFLILIVMILLYFIFVKTKKEKFISGLTIDKAFVINMDRDIGRMNKMKQQLFREQIPYERFRAINGKELNIDELVKNNQVRLERKPLFTGAPHFKEGREIGGSLGCAMSHMKIWSDFVNPDNTSFMAHPNKNFTFNFNKEEFNSKNFSEQVKNNQTNDNILILEDDTIIKSDLLKKLKDINVPDDWDIIYLGGTFVKGKRVNNNVIKPNPNDFKFNYGTWAYIINKKGAKKLLKLTKPLFTYIDVQLLPHYSKDLNVYYTVPFLVEHDFNIDSTRGTDDKTYTGYTDNFVKKANKVIIT